MAWSAGDELQKQFEALYAEYGKRVYRFCHRLSGNPSDAEDLTQEVFLAAYRGLEEFRGRSSLQTWLYRIAVFHWRKMRSPETAPLEIGMTAREGALGSARENTDRILLDRAIGALPEIFREAFLLVKVEELTCREAAEVIGVPQGTVKFRVYRAVHLLRSRLRDEGWGDVLEGKEACNEM